MSDWYLEDTNGVRHKARFERMRLSDSAKAKWTAGLDWRKEVKASDRQTHKLIDVATGSIQGAVSISDAGDHVYIHFLEVAPPNRSSADPRRFVNVTRLLIGFAGLASNKLGYDGFLVLTPKSHLEGYYARNFNAFPVGRQRMGIHGIVSNQLIGVYYT